MSDLRYPIGRFERPTTLSAAERASCIDDIAAAPGNLRNAVDGLSDAQLDTPYRPGGWTVRQVVHHVPDSHLNAYVRFRLGLTRDGPRITTYDEARWAELPDARTMPAAPSLQLLDGLHQRWVALLRSMDAADFARTISHPEMGDVSLDDLLALYAWHGKHHAAHITSLREREGW
ncbi:MAG TPA: putative metal-dependent hydrolase [Gemmatimonadaceae bacterium]|nr:putative metal-dependent hydrolase [Gemmatimonadaceae bacterium]